NTNTATRRHRGYLFLLSHQTGKSRGGLDTPASRRWLFAGTINPQRILVHHFVTAANILLGQKALHDTDLEVDAVDEDSTGVAHGPVGAEDESILAERSPQEIECGGIRRRAGDRLELVQSGRQA